MAFTDDCFLSNKKLAHAVFDEIIKNDLDVTFYITAARVDSADEELYKKLKKAGVVHIQFGLESGNQDVLDFYNKQTTLKQIRYAVNLSHRMGFFTAGTFIFGAPFETKYHFRNTVRFAKSLPLDSVSFLPLRYMVGSKLWSEAVNEGKIDEREYLVIAGAEYGLGWFTQKELIAYCKKAQASFYLRPMFIIKLIASSLRNDNIPFLQSYVSFLLEKIKRIHLSGGHK